MENQFGNPIRVPRRVGNCDRGALRGAQQGETIKPQRIDHSFEIGLKRGKGNLRYISIGQPDAATVKANETRAAGKRMQKRRGYRTLPVVLNMAEPMSRSDEDWTRAHGGNGEIDAVLGLAKSDRLNTRRTRGRFADVGLRRRFPVTSIMLFANLSNEPMALAGQGENEPLFLAGVADGATNRRNPAADGRR
jgi:hypothetical protein